MQCLLPMGVCVTRGYRSHLGLTILRVPCSLMLMMDWEEGEKKERERDRERRLHFRFRSLALPPVTQQLLRMAAVGRRDLLDEIKPPSIKEREAEKDKDSTTELPCGVDGSGP